MLKTANTLFRYKKNFPLDENLPFLRYIQTIDNIDFSPYILIIEKTPKEDGYLVEVVYAPSMFLIAQPGYGLADSFFRYILFNKCLIKYSEKTKEITLEAFPDSDLYLLILIFRLLVIGFFVFLTAHTGVLLLLIPVLIILLSSFSIYCRDIRRVETLGKLAMKTMETKGN